MKISELRQKLGKILNSKNSVKVYALLGVLAMALILISELFPSSSKQEETKETREQHFSSGLDYAGQTEKRLAGMLSEIKDVGQAEVILSTEGSEEYVYAEDVSSDRALRDSDHTEKFQSKLVLAERSGTKEPLVRKVLLPKFSGALVICDGGGSLTVKERVIKAVSAALDLPTNKICVECRNR